MLKEILDSKPEKHISSGKFSISSVGGCWRKKFSELKGLYKEEFNEKTFRIFAQGDFFHQRMVSEFVSKGPSQDYQVAAAEIDIRDTSYISGRCDMILSHTKSKELYIVDFKSCSPWVFKNAQNGTIAQNYQDQVLLYEHIFHIPRGYLLFINKASSEVEEFKVEYNYERAQFLVGQIKFFFENFVEKEKLPPRCDGGVWGCACCWPKQPRNKPMKAQLEATVKQQNNIPELFEEFILKTKVALPSQPQTTNTPGVVLSDSEQKNDKKWVKV